MKKTLSSYSAWKPTGLISQGAVAYHNAVTYSSWHISNIKEMIKLIKKNIKNDDVIVDFGAGTGSSSLYFIRDIPCRFSLFLVDNSPSWLANAYSLFNDNPNVTCLLLEKNQEKYQTLDQLIGVESVNHILSANTVHLIPNIADVFKGIYDSLKPGGTFTFQSGNINREEREKGLLMIDDTITNVHDIAISIIKTDKKYREYKKNISEKVKKEQAQRKFVFPEPRLITYYLNSLKDIGFSKIELSHKKINIRYEEWLSFLRVRRLQAGILPEIGGKKPTAKEELDRDKIIVKASELLFRKLEKNNPLSNYASFTAEWTYVQAKK